MNSKALFFCISLLADGSSGNQISVEGSFSIMEACVGRFLSKFLILKGALVLVYNGLAMLRHLAPVSLLVGVALLAVAAAQEDELYPHTRERGRAAVEYDDDEIHIVAAYYYSQRQHDSPWLLIEAAVSAERVMEIHRDEIRLVLPDGRELPLATQRRFARDIRLTRLLVQNASVTRHGIGAYFKRDQGSTMRFFALPFQGIVHDFFVVDKWRMAWGDLFFVSPTGVWDPGAYSLVIQHDDVRAELPIRLE